MNEPKKPDGLSPAGKRFWDFLFDTQKADGNDEHSLIRSELISGYKHNLKHAPDFPRSDMECDHGFIQWLFPLPTEGVNPRAPVLSQKDYELMKTEPEVQKKLLEHFQLFIEFMGIKSSDNMVFEKQNPNQWNGWIDSGHNNLRISRLLESLTDFGLEKTSKAFYQFLNKESQRTESEGEFIRFRLVTHNSCSEFWANSQNGTHWGPARY